MNLQQHASVTHTILSLEGKLYNSKDNIFVRGFNPVNHNADRTAGLTADFSWIN